MSGQKKNIGLIALVAVVVIAAGGVMLYLSKNTTSGAGSDSASIANPENVATAAGDPTDSTDISIVDGGLKVEPGNPVVARVNGEDISRLEVYHFIKAMPQNIQQLPAEAVYPMAMEQVISNRLVQAQADATDITESEKFKTEMDKAKRQIARHLYLEQQVQSKVTDDMVKKAYDEYIKDFSDVEERRARHILVETEEKAKAVVEKLKKDNDFPALAQSLSIGPSAPKGGDLGYFAKADMVPEFANAVFQMEKNSILETPVKTQFGWHIIQLVDIRQRPKPTFEQMAPSIEAELRGKALEELLGEWRKKAKIEKFDINGDPLKEGANVFGVVPSTKDSQENQDG